MRPIPEKIETEKKGKVRGQKETGKGRGKHGRPKGGVTQTLTGGDRKGMDHDKPNPLTSRTPAGQI